jgi:peroxiredoxin
VPLKPTAAAKYLICLDAIIPDVQPTCHTNHLPPYLQKYDEFKAKGVDVIAVVAANDLFVMSGWGRFEGLQDKVGLRTSYQLVLESETCCSLPLVARF